MDVADKLSSLGRLLSDWWFMGIMAGGVLAFFFMLVLAVKLWRGRANGR